MYAFNSAAIFYPGHPYIESTAVLSYVTIHEKIDHNAAKIVFSYGPKQPAYAHTLVSRFIA